MSSEDFRSYLSERTEGKLSAQEIDAIADHGIIIDGEKMTVEKAAEEYLDQVPSIFIYAPKNGDRGKKDFLKHACLSLTFESINTDEGVMPQVVAREVGHWVIGKGDQSSFGATVWTESKCHLASPAKFDNTVNNAIVVNSIWLDSEWGNQLKIAIYLAG